jgi:hypothetical protein
VRWQHKILVLPAARIARKRHFAPHNFGCNDVVTALRLFQLAT